ncbi:4-hydroxy-tetrahydrodipicolinate reductase [Roseivivax isoporae]|uniref:4-hydroxy-tetrahydrodipicolinate reductase n=1 Tax=Roseivivax isoporae LMG 25204 TaxID=1449351 RepID=X7F6X2_9RHOB|nr:4-hydroxy-tetrahydrodipicolinate reductase [Roseivivax isoporae]ETX28468.1 dihydrodipicolinate reductase [Roseivivax isoporae LMG 25204]
MEAEPGVVVTGVSGRMGRMLVQEIAASDRLRLAGALERPGHDWIGQDLGLMLGGTENGVIVGSDLGAALEGAAAVVDFTAPAATIAFARAAGAAGAVHVIGTTGFSDAELDELGSAGTGSVQIRAGNMSLGVNLLVQITRQVAAALGPDWDVEVVEAHHGRKVDAPSGTALMLGEAAAEGHGVRLSDVAERGRDGITGARKPGAIGFSAIRGGDIVGEHDVLFAGPGERVVLRHMATDRGIFARGALRAVLWGIGKAPGRYDMTDVLGL